MASPKSPFYVVQGLLSPKLCEQAVDQLAFYEADYSVDDVPLPVRKHNQKLETLFYNFVQPHIKPMEEYFGFEHRGTEKFSFEYRIPGTKPEPKAGNSKFINNKWVRTSDRDFTAVIFLTDYQEKVPFDSDYEVYGGKLEFPQWGFSFNPIRGTMIVFPSVPNFIHAFSEIMEGELITVNFSLAAQMPYMFVPSNFPGDYRTWFK